MEITGIQQGPAATLNLKGPLIIDELEVLDGRIQECIDHRAFQITLDIK